MGILNKYKPEQARVPVSNQRIKTGIAGFDSVVDGGLVKNSINLVSGGPGAGKTIFCMQFILSGARDFGEKGVYISFEETEEELKADVEGLGMNFVDVEDKVKFLYYPIWPSDISKFPSILKDQIALFEPSRIVIDSVSALGLPMEDDYERRKQIFRVKDILKNSGATSLLTSEAQNESSMGEENNGSKFGMEEFLTDSVIMLHYAGIGGEADRAIRVIKMRRTKHARGPVPMTIDKTGVKVFKSKI